MNVKNRKFFLGKLLFITIVSIFLSACKSNNNVDKTPSFTGDISDNESWYALPLDSRMSVTQSSAPVSGINSSLVDMDIYIPIPNSSLCVPWDDLTAPARPCTLDDVDHDIEGDDDYEPVLNATLSTGSFSGVGEFKIRGNYSRTLAQKSYSMRLDSDINLLDYQRKFQLNKHLSDSSRIRNKLAYDLIRAIPNLTSLKTQFVHLSVTDDVNGTIDYGLYTHVEALREEFLINRGWNKDDNLYNANNFLFDEWALENLQTDEDGDPLNEANFNTFLEIKAGKDHRMVSEMLRAVNSDQDIDSVVATYFSRDNYITWIALNLVLGNQDVSYHNYFLYNPIYGKKFYFVPWDYDGAWSSTQYLGKAEYGIAVLMEVPLHRKFLRIQKNRDDVYAMAEKLRTDYITNIRMQELIDSYESSVLQAEPTISSWRTKAEELIPQVDTNIALYKSVIGHPMPFYERASYSNGTFSADWDVSEDFEGDAIVYDLNVSSDYDFNTTVLSVQGLSGLNYSNDTLGLAPGTYYMKVISREVGDPTHYQEAFNRLRDPADTKTIYGTVAFDVQ